MLHFVLSANGMHLISRQVTKSLLIIILCVFFFITFIWCTICYSMLLMLCVVIIRKGHKISKIVIWKSKTNPFTSLHLMYSLNKINSIVVNPLFDPIYAWIRVHRRRWQRSQTKWLSKQSSQTNFVQSTCCVHRLEWLSYFVERVALHRLHRRQLNRVLLRLK